MTLPTFGSDGKIAVPPAMAKALSLRAGVPYHLFVESNQLVLQPLNEVYFADLRGMLAGEGITPETIREDKLTQRAFEEQKLHRIAAFYPS